MITIKRLAECTIADAAAAWNKGFSDYYVQMSLSVDDFVNRISTLGLSPTHSIVAWADGEPVGIILNGFRQLGGKRVAWNGGTCVAPAYRKQGVGRAMLATALQIYREEGAQIALLEAFRQNTRAISLYEELGYQITDRLLFLQTTEPTILSPFAPQDGPYQIKHGIPADVQRLPFYQSNVPWQTQWQMMRDGEAVLVQDERGETVGYALYKRAFDEAGKVTTITLCQCVSVENERTAAEAILRCALQHVFTPAVPIGKRTTFNLPASQTVLISVLEAFGFTPSIEQVHMQASLT